MNGHANVPPVVIPKLSDYDIHPKYGFLPGDPQPLRRLPSYYEPWEIIMDQLQALLLAKQIRNKVDKLPKLDTSRLETRRQWQRAYLVLSFIGQAYVWGKNEDAMERMPSVIAVPWIEICEKLEVEPIITYAAVELYNFFLIDPEGPWDLSNLAMQHTFSGSMDEQWFFLISIAIEAAGAPALPAIISCLEAIDKGDHKSLLENLRIIESTIAICAAVLIRMYEKNDPHVFFHRTRPYMNGWVKSDDLPRGVLYEGVTKKGNLPNGETCIENGKVVGTFGKYAGASAGQSTLIHVLDVALGVQHDIVNPVSPSSPNLLPSSPDALSSPFPSAPTSPRSSTTQLPPTPSSSVIHEMRKYMPGPHRRFIEAVGSSYSIRSYIASLATAKHLKKEEVSEITETFNRCVEGMKAFRDKHIQMVTVYIVIPARKRMEVGHQGVPAEVQTERIQKVG
ncbi:hypothetical protein HDU97_001787 [Phlyctochytrium planicorne]|nr:hypothetical protein HDU97_001787 [Phlyctochytrium planicorne]